MDTLIAVRSDEFKQRREVFKEDVTQIHRVMAIGLGAGMIFSVVLLLSFSNSLFKSLRVLVENSERFAKGKELLPALQGDDEIVQIDRVFREMTGTIETTRARERDLLRMVSHDLRTPLNTVLATLETVSEGTYGEISEQGKVRLQRAEVAVDRLIKLTNNLLDMEKLRAGYVELNLQGTNLSTVLSTAIENVSALAESKKIQIENKSEDLNVLADEERLVQVLINLLANAIKFSDDGKNITIESKKLETNFVELRLIDKGCGISLEEQGIIFEPFRQAKDAPSAGSGIGLAISKSIIEAHGGSIGVVSKSGEGSTFWIRLRLAI